MIVLVHPGRGGDVGEGGDRELVQLTRDRLPGERPRVGDRVDAVLVDREVLLRALENPGTRAALRAVASGVLEGEGQAVERPLYLDDLDSPTLGEWGGRPGA